MPVAVVEKWETTCMGHWTPRTLVAASKYSPGSAVADMHGALMFNREATTTDISFAKHLATEALSFQTLLTLLWGRVGDLANKKRLEGMQDSEGLVVLQRGRA